MSARNPDPFALETQGLSRNFGHFKAVTNVSLQIPVGARHALIGPNGAGKTTLVNVISGQLGPSSGRISVLGKDVTARSQRGRVRAALCRTFQVNQLFTGLTVLENVLATVNERDGFSAQFWRRTSALGTCLSEAHDLLSFVELFAERDRLVRELPYGKRRLLEIAIALATRPKVLILDEPAAGVPARDSEVIFERIAALPRDLTVIFIEHDMGLVFRFAERITVLVGGQILIEGSPREISTDQRVKDVYLGQRTHVDAAS